MAVSKEPKVRVTMLIEASPEQVYRAFVEPEWLTRFWLSKASGHLRIGEAVEWAFMVQGATAMVIATRLDPGKHIAWRWEDGQVDIDLETFESGTAITLTQQGLPGTAVEKVAAALDSTEGFTIALCDLKTLLESGKSAGLVRAKCRLIEARAKE